MALPTFVVAGTQKAATTWLYESLNEHPEVFVPTTKELHFLCAANRCRKAQWGKGVEWYTRQFPESDGPWRAWGELSIDYMFYPCASDRLKTLNPDAKILFVLRDPAERAYSAYWMTRRARVDFPSFRSFIHADSDFVSRGFYYRQVQRYRALFPDDQIKILIYEDIRDAPITFVSDVFRFIGVDPSFEPKCVHDVIAQTKQLKPHASVVFYRWVAPILRVKPVLWVWRRTKQVTGIKRTSRGKLESARGYPPMDPRDRADLNDIYRGETEQLFDLIGRRVESWGT